MERNEIISKLCKEAAETTPDLFDKISSAAKAQGLVQSGGAPSGAGSAANGDGAVKSAVKTVSKGKIAAIAAGTLAVLLAVTAVAVPLALDSGSDVGGNGGLDSAEGGNGSDSGDETTGGGSDNGDGSEIGGDSAEGDATESGVYNGLKYTLGWDGTYYECAGFAEAPAAEAVIAAEYNGKPVTHIGSGAFKDCDALTTVTLPESVTWILNHAFMGCSNLANINLENITNIGVNAFYECSSLTSITLCADRDSGLTIGGGAFAKTAVTEITIPVFTYCEPEVFVDCKNLTKVTAFGMISNKMFVGCSNLSEVYFEGPIGNSPFYGTLVYQLTYGYDMEGWNFMVDNGVLDSNWNEYGTVGIIHCTDGDIILYNN